MSDSQKQLKDLSFSDTVLTAVPLLEMSAINGLENLLEFLLNSQNIAGQMFVSNEKTWYYDDDSRLHTYGSLPGALAQNPGFGGVINVTEDMEWNNGNIGASLYLNNGKNITIDLNGNTLSVNNSFALATIVNNTDVTIRNGTIREDADGYNASQMFWLANGGKLRCEQLKIDMRDAIERTPASNYYVEIFAINEYDPYTLSTIDHNGMLWNYARKIRPDNLSVASQLSTEEYALSSLSSQYGISADACSISLDRFCDVSIKNSSHGYNMLFWVFEPSKLLKIYGYADAVSRGETVAGNTRLTSYVTHANGRTFLSALTPSVYCDGNCELKVDAENPRIKNDASLDTVQYGTYVNGAWRGGLDFQLGPNGKMAVEHGHGIYSAQENVTVTLHGGTVVGSNGITMRAGTLKVPADANPTVIGNADYFKYNPTHAGGQAGAGLFVGHAVMLETCTNTDSSYGLVSANIESGQYISKNNKSIGSVQLAKSFPNFYKSFECFDRARGFVKGGTLNKVPDENEYELAWDYDKPERTLSAFYGDSVRQILSTYQNKSSTQSFANQMAANGGDPWLDSKISSAV